MKAPSLLLIPATAVNSPAPDRSAFFVWMAAACVLVAFAGFAPTYWLQLPAGTFVGSPLLHLHGLLFSAWTIYLLCKRSLAARGRITRHRSWGLLGVSLATAMVLVGFAVANNVLAIRLAAGFGDRARAFHIASTSMITLFGMFVAAAIVFVARPEIHKRLMLLATASMLASGDCATLFRSERGNRPGTSSGLGPPDGGLGAGASAGCRRRDPRESSSMTCARAAGHIRRTSSAAP